ncbi:hypothetical protein VTH06DRAFT_1223 [Thermothelomyces fergusii]
MRTSAFPAHLTTRDSLAGGHFAFLDNGPRGLRHPITCSVRTPAFHPIFTRLPCCRATISCLYTPLGDTAKSSRRPALRGKGGKKVSKPEPSVPTDSAAGTTQARTALGTAASASGLRP